MRKIFGILFLTYVNFSGFAQENPPDLQWKQIETKHATIIFSKELSKEALRVANLLDYIYDFETQTLKTKPKSIPVLLFNQSTTANGFAGLRPRRSVWFTTPEQSAVELGNVDWLTTLGTHEYRHVVQYSKINSRITRILSTLYGQTGQLMGQFSIPYWFFEGDAVCTETAFSEGGRGRIPQFNMQIRTMLVNGVKYSYNKAKLQSYKDMYPTHYHLGWLLTSYARKQYGADIFDKVISSTTAFPIWPYAFSMSVKYHTGNNERQLYDKTMNELGNEWKTQTDKTIKTDFNKINIHKKRCWTNYNDPHYLPDSSIIVRRGSLDNISALFQIFPNGTEKKITDSDAGMISVAGTKVTWARQNPDKRWGLRDYSDIVIYDVSTKKEIQLTKKGKYFAPALSPDGSTIAAVKYGSDMNCFLALIDTQTGNEIQVFDFKNHFLRTPQWATDGKEIVFTASKIGGSDLEIINIETGKIETVLPYSSENIGRPVFYQDYIIYNSPRSGIDNIYAVNRNTKQIYQIVSSQFGAFNPKIKGDKMLYIDYQINGYDIAAINLRPETWVKIENIQFTGIDLYSHLKQQEGTINFSDTSVLPNQNYEITKYKKWKHAFNLHSWGIFPYGETGVDFRINTGNMLNTVYSAAGMVYNRNTNTSIGYLDVMFTKYYPKFEISGTYGNRKETYLVRNLDSTLSYDDDFWTEAAGNFKVFLPLNLSKGLYYSNLNINVEYSYTEVYNKLYRYLSESGNAGFSTFSYGTSFSKYKRQALRDIYPRLGAYVFANYKHTPLNTNYNGFLLTGYSSLYFPGILKHHSLHIAGGYEEQKKYSSIERSNYYSFASYMMFPRGYEMPLYEKYGKISVDYGFPIWYPDLGLGSILYFKRLRGSFFYDFADIKPAGIGNHFQYSSTGVELFLEFHIFRIQYPFEIGWRTSYRIENEDIVNNVIMFTIPMY